MSEDSLSVTSPLVNRINSNFKTNYGNNLLLVTTLGFNYIYCHTKSYPPKLSATTKNLPYHTTLILLEEYIKYVT